VAQFWKNLARRLIQRTNSSSPESILEATQVDIDYLSLEPRRVLNANFTLLGGMLDLDNFSETNDENLSIHSIPNFYQFELDEGTWAGVDSALVSGNGTSILTANASFLNEVSVRDNLGIDLDVNFGNVDLSQLNSTTIVTSGSIGQSALTTLVAPTLNLTAFDIELTNNDNDFDTISFDATTTASLADIDRIEIFNANAGDQIDVRAAGIDLTGTIAADEIWFQSTQGLTQVGSSSMVVNNLLMTGQGDFDADSALNDITNISSDIDGDLSLDVINGTHISSLNCNGTIFCGINVTGNLEIFSDDGDITQDADAALLVGGNAFFATQQGGDICLAGGDSDADGINDNLVVGGVSFDTSGDVDFVEGDDILIDGITAGNNFRFIGDRIVLNSNVTANSLLLQASDGVVSNGNTINVGQLLLTGTGNFEVASLSNMIQNIAADITGDVLIGSSSDLNVGSLVQVSCLGNIEVCGLQVAGNVNVELNNASISQSASIGVSGTLTVDANDGDVCLSGGDCDGDGINDNDFNVVDVINADQVEIADINGLIVAGIQANQAAIVLGQTASGQITINGNVDVADQLLLQSPDGVNQINGTISTNELLVIGTGDFSLANPANAVSFLAADIDGSLQIAAGTDLRIDTLTYNSNCSNLSVVVCGLDIEGDLEVTLANTDLTQTAAIIVGGLTTIDVGSGDVCLSLGDCDADGFNDNDFGEINIIAADEVEIADINDISLRGLNISGSGAIIAGQTDLGKITLDGNIVTQERLLLQATDGALQLGGSIAVQDLILDGSGDFHLCLDNSIGSTTTAGRVSADVLGDVYLGNRFGIELIEQNFTTKSGTLIDHAQFQVSDNLSVISNATNSIAIFDSTQINVGGKSSFIATGENADIVVDDLNAAGAIGIATAEGNARIINQHSNGIVFRGDDVPGTTATEMCAHFEQSTINGDLFSQATNGDISNEANATLEVNGLATLIAGTTNSSNVTDSNNEFDIKLGLKSNDDIRLDTLSASADQASLQLDDSVEFSNTAIGSPTATDANGGTLFMSVDGSVTQTAGILLSADNVAITVSDYLKLDDIDADQVAFESNGFANSSTLGGVPADLPDDDSDRFAPRHTSVDAEYGIIVSSQNDLTITTISDALDCQQDLTGISADNGHAFVQTLDTANIHFDGSANTQTLSANGTTFGLAADMQNGHVLTTVAGGDLTIGENTVLQSASGTVADISAFTTDEGVDFTIVTKEGPQFNLFLPTPSDDPTTKTVNTDDAQFIGLNFGRAGEQNFIVEVDWADGTLDVLNFDTNIGNRFERIAHTFTNEFLLANFELPTFLNFYNDPAINLFDNSGQTNLNGGPNDLNTNDNFVLAFSDSRPQGDLQIGSVSRPEALVRDTIIPVNNDQVSSETEANEFGQKETVVEEEVSDAYLIRLDETGLEIKETRQDLEESNVVQDVIAQWKRRVEQGTQFPPGQYRINWTESGVSFSIEFEKGAQEDLQPDELEPVDQRRDSGDLTETDQFLGPDKSTEIDAETADDLRLEPDTDSQPKKNHPVEDIQKATTTYQIQPREEEVDIVIEDVSPRCRASLIAAGALAIGVKDRQKNRDEKLVDELAQVTAEGRTFSFLKSARVSRRVGR